MSLRHQLFRICGKLNFLARCSSHDLRKGSEKCGKVLGAIRYARASQGADLKCSAVAAKHKKMRQYFVHAAKWCFVRDPVITSENLAAASPSVVRALPPDMRTSSLRQMIVMLRSSLNSFENAFTMFLDEETRQGPRQLRNSPKSSPAPEPVAENRIAPNAKQRLVPFWATISPAISNL